MKRIALLSFIWLFCFAAVATPPKKRKLARPPAQIRTAIAQSYDVAAGAFALNLSVDFNAYPNVAVIDNTGNTLYSRGTPVLADFNCPGGSCGVFASFSNQSKTANFKIAWDLGIYKSAQILMNNNVIWSRP